MKKLVATLSLVLATIPLAVSAGEANDEILNKGESYVLSAENSSLIIIDGAPAEALYTQMTLVPKQSYEIDQNFKFDYKLGTPSGYACARVQENGVVTFSCLISIEDSRLGNISSALDLNALNLYK